MHVGVGNEVWVGVRVGCRKKTENETARHTGEEREGGGGEGLVGTWGKLVCNHIYIYTE